MSMLQVRSRPVEVFDVKNRYHRDLVGQFIQTNSWGHSPVRFIASEATEVVVGTIQRQLLEFYVEKEFAKRG